MPLFDAYENLIVVTSRKFRTSNKEEFPHLHESFNKKYYLYGLNVAKESILRKGRAIIVEGQFDTVHLQSHGIRTVVGVLGSAFTIEHACVLRRYCEEVYLVFDSDNAGEETLKRSMDMLAKHVAVKPGDTIAINEAFNMTIVPTRLPKGFKDPDEFVRSEGAEKFKMLLIEAKIERNQFIKKGHDARFSKQSA